MQLKRNDLCHCGSNKKYKNCCWSKDRASSNHKKVIFLRVQAIAEIKKNPRGYTHWNLTNKILDEIIKDKLKDAPLLKYRPEAWIQPLYKAYFLLRSDYWRIIYATLIDESDSTSTLLLNTRPLEIPTYLRIISLLLRIIIDRVGLTEYKALPPLPLKYAIQLEFGGFPYYNLGINAGIFKYIDEITNNASREVSNFFLETRDNEKEKGESINGNTLFPIPFYEYSEYVKFIEKSRKKFYQSLSKQALEQTISVKDQDGKRIDFIGFTPSVASAIKDPIFKIEFLPYIVEFIRKVYGRLANKAKREEVLKICNFFYYFFKNAPFSPDTPLYQEKNILETHLLLEGISEELLMSFLYNPEKEKESLSNPLKASITLFEHSLDLFEKPFIKDRYGRVSFSLFWLFDALLYKLTKLLRGYLSIKRSQRAENYISFLIDQFITEYYPTAPFSKPFKIILKNANRVSEGYKRLKDNLKRYKFTVKEIIIPNHINRIGTFIEVDAAFTFHNTLFLIEIKDDLFWDTRDLSDLIILWGRLINKKAKEIQNIFEDNKVRSYLNSKGIIYEKVESFVISQNNIDHPDFQHIVELYQELSQLHHNVTTGKEEKIISFIFPSYPPYPWTIGGK
jgi:hypothetical protein